MFKSNHFLHWHFGIHLRDGFFAVHREDEIFHGAGGLPHHALVSARRDVRRADDVRQLEQRMIRRRRLLIQNVRAVTAHLPGFQCLDEVGCVDDFAARAIQNEHPLFHLGNVLGANHVARLRREVGVQRKIITCGKNFVE